MSKSDIMNQINWGVYYKRGNLKIKNKRFGKLFTKNKSINIQLDLKRNVFEETHIKKEIYSNHENSWFHANCMKGLVKFYLSANKFTNRMRIFRYYQNHIHSLFLKQNSKSVVYFFKKVSIKLESL